MSPRRRHEEEHENHERWLVSYADFITLMFAFFVVMFASSQSGKMSTKAVSSAVENALQKEMISSYRPSDKRRRTINPEAATRAAARTHRRKRGPRLKNLRSSRRR